MITFLTIIHVVVSVFLILVVLLQQGKGQDFAGAFGGGGSQANVGARSGTTVLHKMTTIAAVMFMLTSLSLTILISRPGIDSVIAVMFMLTSLSLTILISRPGIDSVIPDDAQIPITEPVPDAEETPEGAPDDGPDPEP